jgi:hypothetical protein
MHLTDREKEELKRLSDAREPLPAKFKLRLFADAPEVELMWQGKTSARARVPEAGQVADRGEGH